MKRSAAPGISVIHTIGLLFITLMMSAVAIDLSYYFTVRNNLQTAADAAALSAAKQLFLSDAGTTAARQMDVEDAASIITEENLHDAANVELEFGFIDPETRAYDPDSFGPTNDPDYSFTGGFNAVRAIARNAGDNAASTIMARMLGIDTMDIGAESIAMMDQNIRSIEDGGLRPIYVCEGQFQVAMADGNLENNVIRIYGDRVSVDGNTDFGGACPEPGSGNWGFADLRDCSPGSPGASTTAEWFANGFPGLVEAGQCYSTKPGNFISSNGVKNALDSLIESETTILVPLYDSWDGGGSNSQVNVSGFAGFVVTDYVSNGPAANRYIEGHFTKAFCDHGCSTGDEGSGPGGAIVKLRLTSTGH